jgi:broad specificity phosphatase PhoE
MATPSSTIALRPLRLFLIRHAQSLANIQTGVISGRSNHVPLTSMGQRQAIALANRWHQRGTPLHAIYSSTAVRAVATCM